MSNTIGVNDLLAQMREMSAQVKDLQNTITTPGLNSAGMNNVEGVNKPNTQNSFTSVLKNAADKVNEAQMHSNKLAEAFQNGDPNIQISEVMIASQKSNISFQAMLQVRNKIIQAYQEIMNMPV